MGKKQTASSAHRSPSTTQTLRYLTLGGAASLVALTARHPFARFPSAQAAPIPAGATHDNGVNTDAVAVRSGARTLASTGQALVADLRRGIPCDVSTFNGAQTVNVNTASDQEAPAIATAPDGSTILGWVDQRTTLPYDRIFMQALQNNQLRLPSEAQVDQLPWDKSQPYIVPTESGPVFLYTHQSDGDGSGLLFSHFSYDLVQQPNKDSLLQGQQLHSNVSLEQSKPHGAARQGGGWAAVFQSAAVTLNNNRKQILYRRFDTDNVTPLDASELVVSTDTSLDHENPFVVVNPDNSAVVAFNIHPEGGGLNQIGIRGINTNGTFADTSEILVSISGEDCIKPQLIRLDDGTYIMSMLSKDPVDTLYTVYIQRLNANRTPNGAPIALPSFQVGGSASAPITRVPNGFAIAVPSYHELGNIARGYVQYFDSSVNATTDPIKIDENADGNRHNLVSIAHTGEGRVNIAMESYITASANKDITFATFNPNLNLINQNITMTEGDGKTAIAGLGLERTTYNQTQVDVTIDIPLGAGSLGTDATIPAGASVNFDAGAGQLTLSTSGAHALRDMNDLLACLHYTPSDINYDQSFNLTINATDDGPGNDFDGSVPVNITPVDDAPSITTHGITISQGERVVPNIVINDVDTAANDITITPNGVIGGSFQRINTTSGDVVNASIINFNYQEYLDGAIVFQHDSTTTIPNWSITASDGTTTTPTSNPAVNFSLNQAPTLTPVNFALKQGETKLVNTLGANDLNNPPAELTYTVAASHVTFEKQTSPGVWQVVTTFTEADAQSGDLRIVHDDSDNAPLVLLQVTDGLANSAQITYPFNFNSKPTLSADLDLSRGQEVQLTNANLQIEDDTDFNPSEQTYTVTYANQAGYFAHKDSLKTPITTFTQRQVDNEEIYLVHDGSETAPDFTLTISAGDLSRAGVSPDLNYNPVAPESKGGSSFAENRGSQAGTAVAGAILMGYLKLKRDNYRRNQEHPLANMVKSAAGLGGVRKFEGGKGLDFVNIVKNVVEKAGLNGLVNELHSKYEMPITDQYIFKIKEVQEATYKLKILAGIIAKRLEPHVGDYRSLFSAVTPRFIYNSAFGRKLNFENASGDIELTNIAGNVKQDWDAMLLNMGSFRMMNAMFQAVTGFGMVQQKSSASIELDAMGEKKLGGDNDFTVRPG